MTDLTALRAQCSERIEAAERLLDEGKKDEAYRVFAAACGLGKHRRLAEQTRRLVAMSGRFSA